MSPTRKNLSLTKEYSFHNHECINITNMITHELISPKHFDALFYIYIPQYLTQKQRKFYPVSERCGRRVSQTVHRDVAHCGNLATPQILKYRSNFLKYMLRRRKILLHSTKNYSIAEREYIKASIKNVYERKALTNYTILI